MGFQVRVVDLETVTEVGKDISAVLFQYPDTHGSIRNFQTLIEKTHAAGVRSPMVFYKKGRSNFYVLSTGTCRLRDRFDGPDADQVARRTWCRCSRWL